jgi:adenosylcobinamide kinase/adenosylcobinamide-phosphate guanylyltransferase
MGELFGAFTVFGVDNTCARRYNAFQKAGVAQLVEYKLPKLGVAGSNPVARSKLIIELLQSALRSSRGPLLMNQAGFFVHEKCIAMSKKTCFITGGARSGKSAFAERLANGFAGQRAYIATAQALDAEMAAKIEKHRKDRGVSWDTYEEPLAISELIRKLSGRYEVALLDCLTLWLSNIMAHTEGDDEIALRADELTMAVRDFGGVCIIVSNEVGLGIVPDNPLARKFRDLAGMLNQRIARVADEVYFTASGIPMKIK